jgi:hypothetical protein
LEQEPETEPHAMVRHLARVVGIGVETADRCLAMLSTQPGLAMSRPRENNCPVNALANLGLADEIAITCRWSMPIRSSTSCFM